MVSFSKLVRRRTTWATAVYFEDAQELPPKGKPAQLFPSKKLFRGPNHVHTRADPFLYVHGDRLFLFMEKQAADEPGWIEAYVTDGENGFHPLGIVLKEPFHLSYPHVFNIGPEVYLLPESEAANEVRLYRFASFPSKPELYRILLSGPYVDPSLVRVDETWFLFVTSSRGLELFYTDDVRQGELTRHPASPITRDPRFSRCGGVPIKQGNSLLRLAQNGSELYGGNLSLLEIRRISKTEYHEELVQSDIFDKSQRWNRQGGHHMSVASFGDSTVVAVDGQAYDYYIHKLLARRNKILRRL